MVQISTNYNTIKGKKIIGKFQHNGARITYLVHYDVHYYYYFIFYRLETTSCIEETE